MPPRTKPRRPTALAKADKPFVDEFHRRVHAVMSPSRRAPLSLLARLRARHDFNEAATAWLRELIERRPSLYRKFKNDLEFADRFFEGIWDVHAALSSLVSRPELRTPGLPPRTGLKAWIDEP